MLFGHFSHPNWSGEDDPSNPRIPELAGEDFARLRVNVPRETHYRFRDFAARNLSDWTFVSTRSRIDCHAMARASDARSRSRRRDSITEPSMEKYARQDSNLRPTV